MVLDAWLSKEGVMLPQQDVFSAKEGVGFS